MATGDIKDPYGNFNFKVEIDGIVRAAFRECSGFNSSIDVIEHREGGENTTVRKLPALTKYSNITLKWGTTDDHELFDWHMAWAEGGGTRAATRRNLSIVLLDRNGQEKLRWDFVRAWPTKWDGPDFNAEGNDVAIETLEIAHEGMKRR